MKQLFTPLAEPVGALWFLMALGTLWLLWRRQWRSAGWLGGPVVVLFVFGSTPLVEVLVGSAERGVRSAEWAKGGEREQRPEGGGQGTEIRGQRSEDGGGAVVLVLGGGYYVSDRDPYGFALNEGATRILTALELLRREKASALVLGGGLPVPGRPDVTAPSLLEKWIVEWGLAGTARVITNLGTCMNTHDEAVQFRKLQKAFSWRKVLLVTSALHMPRSMALFKKQGLEVEPMACDFKVHGVPGARGSFSLFPSQSRFQVLGLYLHEKVGWWVYRARGWI